VCKRYVYYICQLIAGVGLKGEEVFGQSMERERERDTEREILEGGNVLS
jgi:hypothetical protein